MWQPVRSANVQFGGEARAKPNLFHERFGGIVEARVADAASGDIVLLDLHLVLGARIAEHAPARATVCFAQQPTASQTSTSKTRAHGVSSARR